MINTEPNANWANILKKVEYQDIKFRESMNEKLSDFSPL